MAHPHPYEFHILSRINDAQRSKSKLIKSDVDEFIGLFKEDNKDLKDVELSNRCKFLNEIIVGAFTNLRHTSLAEELRFVFTRELNALESSVFKTSKDRHSQNLERIGEILDTVTPKRKNKLESNDRTSYKP